MAINSLKRKWIYAKVCIWWLALVVRGWFVKDATPDTTHFNSDTGYEA